MWCSAGRCGSVEQIKDDSEEMESFTTGLSMESYECPFDIKTDMYIEYDSGVTIFMVTHLFAFANQMYQKKLEAARFMSAERREDGTRTFRMIDHEPTETSYGLDLYRELIGELEYE